jgi:predicted PurR-regulated permease PerM
MKDVGGTARVQVANLPALVIWGAVAWLAWLVLNSLFPVLFLFLLSLFFAALLDPAIRWLDRRGLSRGMSAGLIALLVLGGIGLAFYFAVPPLADQAQQMAQDAPGYAQRLQGRAEQFVARYPFLQEQLASENLPARLTALGQSLLPKIGRYSLTLLGGIFSLFVVFVLTLYIVADPRPLIRGALFSLPRRRRKVALRVLIRSTQQLHNWIRATFWMMLCIGVMSGIGLWVLGVKSPLLFGIIAGFGEAVPTIGPILSAIPPFLVTLADDPTKALYVLALFVVIQQVENNLLVPRIMASTMRLHPVSVLFFVMSMSALLGPLGILLATPLCAIAKVLYQELYRPRVMEVNE